MFITILVCNVGRSGENHSLLVDLFCCVSLFFVLGNSWEGWDGVGT